ncbi:olfactory receptor 2T1-like [Engystomops pustulosus]|uniref:olfactory receptor 2T1-like n=1 Tax=Engystomops pustulosus TaxID=76066 RepID=UPI003AFB0FC1
MEQNISAKDLRISPFFYKSPYTGLVITIFTLIYLLGVFMNVLIITVVYINDHLHTPMYLFVCNLSIVDMFYITVFIPKILDILYRSNTVTFMQCFSQMYFYVVSASSEVTMLLLMAYDRYVAICNPLSYHSVLSTRVCVLLLVGLWATAFTNGLIIAFPASSMSFCQLNTINQIYCDAYTVAAIACAGVEVFYLVLYIELPLFGLVTFVCSLTSYIKIIGIILQIKSRDGKGKAFSTCSSHLVVLSLYYTTGMSVYMIPPSKYSDVLKQMCTILYATITPVLNPFVYSLRNKDMTNAILILFGVNSKVRRNC